MITGGLSEMTGFSNLVEREFGFIASVINMPVIGIRHNKYSSCYGVIRYFNEKLALRGKTYEMFTKEELEELKSTSSEELPKNILKGRNKENSNN